MTNSTEFAERRQKALPHLRNARADCFLTTSLPNCRYLTGFTGSNAALLLSPERAILFTDPRYETQAPEESDCEVRIAKGSLMKEVATWTRRLRYRSLAFETNRISFDTHRQLKEHTVEMRLRPVTGMIETLRAVKSETEIEKIRTSVQINSAALAEALQRFKTSLTERDLAAEIEYRMRRLGADAPSFETIVAVGERAALPHARPTR